MAQVNPYTGERDTMLRANGSGVVIRLTPGEAEAVLWAQDRGYLPEVGQMRHRDENGPCSWRIRRESAYAWSDWTDNRAEAFGACLARGLMRRIMGAHVILTNRWAV